VGTESDCDDGDAEINPDAGELCDGVDNNCDGATDDVDGDGDGYLHADCGGDDCDDASAQVYPGQIEDCTDGVDNDCDGDTDAADDECGGDDDDDVTDDDDASDDDDDDDGDDDASDDDDIDVGGDCECSLTASRRPAPGLLAPLGLVLAVLVRRRR
jgi:MYXO-CTERM domain-containing protein